MTEEKRVKRTDDAKLERIVCGIVNAIEWVSGYDRTIEYLKGFPQDRGVRPCFDVFNRVAAGEKLPPATVFRALPRYQKYESGTVVIERGTRETGIWQTVVTFVAKCLSNRFTTLDGRRNSSRPSIFSAFCRFSEVVGKRE